ncbi:hypothetical protein [Sphingomonas sp. 3-13AW]|uniref:hypothetical protein n=1 Tax=Sphingomonas sp. 3-13AW TaxID=3050450 RepID=UPI003BB6F915
MNDPKHPVSDAMLDRLRLEMSHYSNFVDLILGDPDSRYGGEDGRMTLIEILGLLIGLTGSEDDAIAWIMNSGGYTDAVNDDVCVGLAHGGFWTLAAHCDWLQVIYTYRDLCPELIEILFRSGGTQA